MYRIVKNIGGYYMSRRKMRLQELDDAFILIRSKLENEEDKLGQNYSLYLRQLQKLEEIDAFVSTYEWVGKSQEARDRVKFIRDSGYDYDLCRRELNLSVDALKSIIKRANKSFSEKIGETTVDLIISRNNTISLGMTEFGICSGKYKLSEILNSDFYEMMPQGKVDFFDIFDCEEEIKVMYMFSQFGMKEILAKCNLKKLALLRYILENPTERYAEEQKDLISLLMGVNIDLDTYLENLDYLRNESLSKSSDYYLEKMGEKDFENEEINTVEDEFVSLSDSLVDDFEPLSEDLEGFVSLASDKDFDLNETFDEYDVLEDL